MGMGRNLHIVADGKIMIAGSLVPIGGGGQEQMSGGDLFVQDAAVSIV